MKTITWVLSATIFTFGLTTAGARASPAAAAAPGGGAIQEQPRTLLSRPIESGGYGAPVVSYTRIAGSDGFLVGGRGGWVINHRLVIGGAGLGLANRVQPPAGATPSQADYQVTLSYGGLWLEYLVAPLELVHASFGTVIGGGELSYHRFRPSAGDLDSNGVFVLDPVAAIEVNVTRFIRLSIQAGYRVVRGVSLSALSNSDASGLTVGSALKFGAF